MKILDPSKLPYILSGIIIGFVLSNPALIFLLLLACFAVIYFMHVTKQK